MAESKILRLKKRLKALRSKPNTGISGKEKVNTLNELAFELINSDLEKTEDFVREALTLAEKLKYGKGKATCNRIIGFVYLRKCEYNEATKNLLESLKISKEIRDKDGVAASYNSLGIISGRLSNYEEALEYYFKALRIKEEIGDKKAAAITSRNIGMIYGKRGDYDHALDYTLKALKIFEEIEDSMGITECYANLGIIFDLQSDYEQALEYYFKSLKIFKETGSKVHIASSYNNIGLAYEKLGANDQALKFLLKGLKVRQEIGDKEGIAASFNNIGTIYAKQGEYKQASKYHLRALKIQHEIGDKAGTARSYIRAGFVNTELKHYDLALRYLRKGLQTAQEIGIKEDQIDGYKCLAELYEAQQNYNKALSYYKKYTEVDKETFNAEKSKQIAEMNAKYETEKKEKEVEIYHLKNVKLRKEIRERKKVEKELEKHRGHLERLVAERTAQLRSLAHELSLVEEKQRRKIATYLHDDIAQALALATVRLELVQDMVSKKNIKRELEAVKKIIDQTTARTRSLTFEVSPPVLYDSGFEPAVEWLAEQFQNQHDIVCELKNDGLPKPVSSDIKIILFQSVRELLTNVAKHAQARTVRVLTEKKGNTIRIEVKDDGVGFNPKILNQKITKNEGFGLFNLKERLRHLRGKLEVSSRVGEGTSIIIMAPLTSSRQDANRKRRQV